jgi:hypothetical protein
VTGTVRRLVRRTAVAAEVIWIYPRAWWLLRNRDLPTTLQALRPRGTDGDVQPEDLWTAIYLGHATTRLLSHLPVDSRCLIRSLVLARLLDRRGIPGRLIIGVRPGEDFAAHAWIEVAARAVLDPGDYGDRRLAEL